MPSNVFDIYDHDNQKQVTGRVIKVPPSDLVDKQKSSNWGDGFIKQLSQDLSSEFPDINGFYCMRMKREKANSLLAK